MAFSASSATDRIDLLNDIVTLATANGWTVLENTTSGFTVEGYVIMKATGLAGADEIYIGIQVTGGESAPRFKLQGYTAYEAGYSFDTQAGAIPSAQPHVPLANNTMSYWISANAQRICGVVKTNNGIYEAFYLGLTLPSTFPQKMPYPLLIAGSADSGSILPSNTTSKHSAFWQAYNDGIAYFLLGAQWVTAGSASELYDYCDDLHCSPYMYPYTGSQVNDRKTAFQYMGKNQDGTYPSFPIALCYVNGSIRNFCGDLDGWNAVRSLNAELQSEDTITIGADTYYVFNNTWRTEDRHYVLLKGA